MCNEELKIETFPKHPKDFLTLPFRLRLESSKDKIMKKKDAAKIFEGREVRSVWDSDAEKRKLTTLHRAKSS